jgi:lipid-A-disaccharide synthase
MALGGDRVAATGVNLFANTTHISSIGLVEALPMILPTLRLEARAKKYLKANPPDLMILVDYPGPNLNLAWFVRKRHPQVPIVYYIAPQLWVWVPWKSSLVQVRRCSDLILAIFPQEAQFFRDQGIPVEWVGHPLMDPLSQAPDRNAARETLGIAPETQVITLLPASRNQEMAYLLPVMAATVAKLHRDRPDRQFLLPVSLPKYRPLLEQTFGDMGVPVRLLDGKQALTAIAAADLAMTKSGTVNMEIALLGVPQMVMYRVHPLTMWIARHILRFKIPFMSPVNLVLNRLAVPEFLQEQAEPDRLFRTALTLLEDAPVRQQIQEDYQALRQALGEPGVADRAAAILLDMPQRAKTAKKG